jgi:hypothetical protein
VAPSVAAKEFLLVDDQGHVRATHTLPPRAGSRTARPSATWTTWCCWDWRGGWNRIERCSTG